MTRVVVADWEWQSPAQKLSYTVGGALTVLFCISPIFTDCKQWLPCSRPTDRRPQRNGQCIKSHEEVIKVLWIILLKYLLNLLHFWLPSCIIIVHSHDLEFIEKQTSSAVQCTIVQMKGCKKEDESQKGELFNLISEDPRYLFIDFSILRLLIPLKITHPTWPTGQS